jgi:hypothetical protein
MRYNWRILLPIQLFYTDINGGTRFISRIFSNGTRRIHRVKKSANMKNQKCVYLFIRDDSLESPRFIFYSFRVIGLNFFEIIYTRRWSVPLTDGISENWHCGERGWIARTVSRNFFNLITLFCRQTNERMDVHIYIFIYLYINLCINALLSSYSSINIFHVEM